MLDEEMSVERWNRPCSIPNADDGFLMVFSAQPFPDADFELDWLRPDGTRNVSV